MTINKAPQLNSNSQLESRLNNNRDDIGRYFAYPKFRFDHTAAMLSGDEKEIYIKGEYIGSGDSYILLPFHTLDSSGLYANLNQKIVTDTWKIDLNTSTIDTTTFIGGIIDGISLAANTDYLIWGFLDPTEVPAKQFKGFGVTARPVATFTSITGTLTKGGACVVSGLTTGHGFRFSVGARVIVRRGSAIADSYNQGTITSVASTTVSVQLDNNTSGVSYGVTLVSGTGTNGLIQLDKFAPKIIASNTVYGGYQYIYMGSLRTNASSNIMQSRKRGDFLLFPQHYEIYATTGETVDAGITYTPLQKWIGLHVNRMQFYINITRTAGTAQGFGAIYPYGAASSAQLEIITCPTTVTNFNAFGSGIAEIHAGIVGVRNAVGGGNTQNSSFITCGYIETEF